jgi:hypothetical protein
MFTAPWGVYIAGPVVVDLWSVLVAEDILHIAHLQPCPIYVKHDFDIYSGDRYLVLRVWI